jgi:membrane-bound lytic murein transglycosylase MltF
MVKLQNIFIPVMLTSFCLCSLQWPGVGSRHRTQRDQAYDRKKLRECTKGNKQEQEYYQKRTDKHDWLLQQYQELRQNQELNWEHNQEHNQKQESGSDQAHGQGYDQDQGSTQYQELRHSQELHREQNQETAQEHESHLLGSHLSRTYTDDLDGLLENRYIRVLTVFNRTNFFLSKGRFFGFEYELIKDYQKFLNKNLKPGELRVVVDFVLCPRDSLIDKLRRGYGDIVAAGMTITPRRSKLVDFTIPYLTGIDEVIVARKDTELPENIEGLAGREIFVRKSSSYYESLVALNRKIQLLGREPVEIAEADENLETEDILEMVNAGVVDITICDSNIAGIWSDILENLTVRNDLKLRTGIEIAWMVRKNNPNLKASLDNFLRKRRRGTLLGNIYFKRYYRNNVWIKNPLNQIQRKNVLLYRKLISKYSQKYGFDWLLIMAMAFQESGLDHSKKSPAGAVGIMQIRPQTASDRRVGIKNIQDPENNIHAAVKYLDFLRSHYFSDPGIRPRDRVRLALASYNAGPAKIRKARSLAEKMGLNPDRWFRNVELAVLKLVGRETVQYVSNINKYYLIYSRAYRNAEK